MGSCPGRLPESYQDTHEGEYDAEPGHDIHLYARAPLHSAVGFQVDRWLIFVLRRLFLVRLWQDLRH